MQSLFIRGLLPVVMGATMLGGCATVEDVNRAQASADAARMTADQALSAAQAAQQRADQANSAAASAQASANAAQSAARDAAAAADQAKAQANEQIETRTRLARGERG